MGGLRVSPDIACLVAVELLICTRALYGFLAPPQPVGLSWAAAEQASVLALTLALVSFTIGIYTHETFCRISRLIAGTAIGGIFGFLVAIAVACAIDAEPHWRSSAGWANAFAVWLAVLLGVRLIFAASLRAGLFARRIIVVGSDPEGERLVAAVRASHGSHVRIAAQLPSDALRHSEAPTLPRASHIVLTGTAAMAANGASLKAAGRDIPMCDVASFWEGVLRRVDVEHVRPATAVPDGGTPLPEHWSRRGLDIVLSLVLIAFTLPLMIVTALAIRLDSPGPVLYRQVRVGLNGRPFTVLKFRSMRTDAEARGPVWASKSDPRVTRVGALIRLVRIDELPQLLNVLHGEMGFIGPRPERPHFTEQLEQVLPRYRERLLVRPGLTGWAQVNYPYGASIEDARAKLSYDLYYVKHRTLLLDILILFATVRVVLFQSGAR